MVLILLSTTVGQPPTCIDGENVTHPTRKVRHDLQVEPPQATCRTYARAFQDLRRTERTAAQDNVAPGLDYGLLHLSLMRAVPSWDVRDPDGLVALEEDAGNAGVGAQEQVVLLVHDAVDVGCAFDMLE